MTEAQVGFLYKIAAALSKSSDNEDDLLKSYYLMRCKDITKGYGLPDKHFSPNIRCPKCCIEWKNNTEVKMRSIKLSKRQKRRLKSKKITQGGKESERRLKDLLNSNELEQTCLFCKNKTITTILKPQKQLPNTINTLNDTKIAPKGKTASTQKNIQMNNKSDIKKKNGTSVYANALDVFSMQNKNNILASAIKEKSKPINNNKKKKDKFAGLCQKAVLASAKLKENSKKQSSLSLFLKASK